MHRTFRLLRTLGRLLVLGTLAHAKAQTPLEAPPRSAHLEYQAPAACPEQSSLTRDVSARLGYDPFVADAELQIRVVITTHGRAHAGRIEITGRDREQAGRRQLPSEHDCAELVHAAAFAVALAIDPVRAQAPVSARPTPPDPAPVPMPPPKPTPPPKPAAPASNDPAPKPTPRQREPLRIQMGAFPMISAWRVPGGVAGGGGLFVAMTQRRWLAALEGHAELPFGEERSAQHAVSASLVSATLVPCLRLGVLLGCALAEIGALQGSGFDVDVPKRDTTLFVATGARAALEIPIARRFFLRPVLDVLAPITRTTLRVVGQPVWTTPPASLAISAAFGVVF